MIWIFHFIAIVSLLGFSKLRKKNNVFYIGTFIYSIFIFGQRWMTGTDFRNYLLYYLIDYQGNEIAYFSMQDFLVDNNLYFGLLMFVCFFISTANFYRFIIKINKHTVLMIFLFLISEVYFMQMSQIRQIVAASFFINAFLYSYSKKTVKSIINIVLAISFHQSAIFLLPFLIFRIPTSRKLYFSILLICFILPIIDISLIFNLPVFSNYSVYIGSVYDVPLGTFHIVKYYVLLIIFTLFLYYIKKFTATDIDKMVLNGVIFYSLFYGLSIQFAPLYRISNYFKLFEIIFPIFYYQKLLINIHYQELKRVLISLFLIIYVGIALTDPYDITQYEFRTLRLHENKSETQLISEIYTYE